MQSALASPDWTKSGRLVGSEWAASDGREGSGPEKMVSMKEWWENREWRGCECGCGLAFTHARCTRACCTYASHTCTGVPLHGHSLGM